METTQTHADAESAGWVLSCRIIGGSLIAIALSCVVGGIVLLGEPGEKTPANIAFALSLLCSSASFALFMLAYIISLLSAVRQHLQHIEHSLPGALRETRYGVTSKETFARRSTLMF